MLNQISFLTLAATLAVSATAAPANLAGSAPARCMAGLSREAANGREVVFANGGSDRKSGAAQNFALVTETLGSAYFYTESCDICAQVYRCDKETGQVELYRSGHQLDLREMNVPGAMYTLRSMFAPSASALTLIANNGQRISLAQLSQRLFNQSTIDGEYRFVAPAGDWTAREIGRMVRTELAPNYRLQAPRGGEFQYGDLQEKIATSDRYVLDGRGEGSRSGPGYWSILIDVAYDAASRQGSLKFNVYSE